MSSTGGSRSSFGYDGGSKQPQSVYVDKEGIVQYDGDPKHGEEYQERAMLSFYSLKDADAKKLFCLKLKNGLRGRAWILTHKRPDMKVEKLLIDGAANAETSVKLFIATVRGACEKVAPLRKKSAFDEFFHKGNRKSGEPIQDFIYIFHISRT